MNPPIRFFAEILAAWTSASVHRPQPWIVGIREKGPGAWTRLLDGPTGIAPGCVYDHGRSGRSSCAVISRPLAASILTARSALMRRVPYLHCLKYARFVPAARATSSTREVPCLSKNCWRFMSLC